jgi:hypothetical protein
MRVLTIPLVALALVAASCTIGPGASPASSTPSHVASGTATAGPTAAPTGTPAPSPTQVSARVTFDGSKCVYTGPTVIPFPASLTVEYAPSAAEAGSWIGIFAVHSGTTQAELDDPGNPDIGEATPSFVYFATHAFSQGAGKGDYRSAVTGLNPMAEPSGAAGKPYDTYMVVCIPSIPGKPVGGSTILHVVDSRT